MVVVQRVGGEPERAEGRATNKQISRRAGSADWVGEKKKKKTLGKWVGRGVGRGVSVGLRWDGMGWDGMGWSHGVSGTNTNNKNNNNNTYRIKRQMAKATAAASSAGHLDTWTCADERSLMRNR